MIEKIFGSKEIFLQIQEEILKNPNIVEINIDIDDDLYTELEFIASEEGVSVGMLASAIITNYFRKLKE